MSTPRYAADVFAGLMAELEAYGDAFERLAATQEQAQLARQFQQLISTLPAQLSWRRSRHSMNGTDGGTPCSSSRSTEKSSGSRWTRVFLTVSPEAIFWKESERMTPQERELSQQLFGGQEKSMGAMEAAGLGIAIGVGAFLKGATDAIYSKDAQHIVGQGAQEMASALFGNGTAFVMYPRTSGKEDQPSHEQTQDGQSMQQDHGQHLERGGRSM
jgi:hypothetical protein